MPVSNKPSDSPPDEHDPHWQRNLWVCVFGAFTTIVAMTLLLPFLPLYVEHLGVNDPAAVVQWSGLAYGATFLSAALTAPLWGRLGDRYGRKLMLIRASLGMAVAMSLIGLAETVWQLVLLRLLAGLLGVLSSGIMAGSLAGPLIGGVLPPLVGIRATFFLAGGVIFITFLGTLLLLREAPRPARASSEIKPSSTAVPLSAEQRRVVTLLLIVASLVMFSAMSVEPIITVYLRQLHTDNLTLMAGVVMSATALGSIIAASRLGRLADRIGYWPVLAGCLGITAITLVPQAWVSDVWQLTGLRFVMGLSLGGLLPCITALIRHAVPQEVAGRILGYSTSSQYLGQVLGPLAGGLLGAHLGMGSVFLGTAALLATCSAVVVRGQKVKKHRNEGF
jgi:MFS family permease